MLYYDSLKVATDGWTARRGWGKAEVQARLGEVDSLCSTVRDEWRRRRLESWCTVIQQRGNFDIWRGQWKGLSHRFRVTRLEFGILYHSALMKSRNFNGYLIRPVLLWPMMKTRLFWRIQTWWITQRQKLQLSATTESLRIICECEINLNAWLETYRKCDKWFRNDE